MIPPPDHHKTAGAAVPGAEVREPLVPREQTLRRRPKRAPLAPEGLGFVELGAVKPEPRLGKNVAARRALGEPKVLAPVRQPRGHVVKPAVAHAARVLDPPPRGFTGTCARFAVARRRGCTWGGHGQQAAAAWWHQSRAAVGCGGGTGRTLTTALQAKAPSRRHPPRLWQGVSGRPAPRRRGPSARVPDPFPETEPSSWSRNRETCRKQISSASSGVTGTVRGL